MPKKEPDMVKKKKMADKKGKQEAPPWMNKGKEKHKKKAPKKRK